MSIAADIRRRVVRASPASASVEQVAYRSGKHPVGVEQDARVQWGFGVARIATALLCAIALVARFIWGLNSATFFSPDNFTAYLTIQSNVAFCIVTAISGTQVLRGTVNLSWLPTLRAIVLSCTVTAGIIFALLIQQAGVRDVRIAIPWSDQLLHFWLPAIALLDWLIAPDRGRARWRSVVFVIGYVISWGAITMFRGSLVGWYPYFFLDPAQIDWPQEFLLSPASRSASSHS